MGYRQKYNLGGVKILKFCIASTIDLLANMEVKFLSTRLMYFCT